MATWRAEVFVNSRVGRINTEVEAATFSGAKEQIYAKHGDVQQIVNLREVRSSSSSSGGSSGDGSGALALVGLVAAAWAFMSFTPWILMGLGGTFGTWIGQKVTGQSLEDYNEREDGLGNKRAAFVVALALILGGIGFVKGDEIKKGFDAPDAPAQVEQAK
jgi:hypothetical protein